MGLRDIFGLGGMRAEDAADRDASDDRYFATAGARSEIDIRVTVARARQVPVIRSSLKVLADSVAGLHFGAFRDLGGDRVERLTDHPVAKLMANPNPQQTGFDFIYSMVDDLAAEGDFFAELSFDETGELGRMKRIPNPGSVMVEEAFDGTKRIRFKRRSGEDVTLVEGEFWHVMMPPLVDDVRGTSPIMADGREAVAVAIALQRYANRLFSNDATPPYVFAMDGQFKDAQSKKNWLNAWSKWVSGRRQHKPGILEYGLKPHRMGLTSEEAQFLETRKELWLDLCRIWRVPPHKVGILDRATFSNIEHQSLEFVIDTLRPILELIERSVTKFLIEETDVFFEFNVESLLRGDIKSRYEAYAMGRQWGWLSVNDVLRMENRNGIGPSGDRYVEPLNMVPVGTGAGDRQPEQRAAIDRSLAFLRESVARNGGRPRLELVRDAA